jgi:hypothetical protein
MDAEDRDLMYAYRDNTVWHVERVDRIRAAGIFSSLALDSAGNPHISYTSTRLLPINDGHILKYAWHNGTTWRIIRIEALGRGGWYTSLDLDSADQPRISFCQYVSTYWPCGALRYAYRN